MAVTVVAIVERGEATLVAIVAATLVAMLVATIEWVPSKEVMQTATIEWAPSKEVMLTATKEWVLSKVVIVELLSPMAAIVQRTMEEE